MYNSFLIVLYGVIWLIMLYMDYMYYNVPQLELYGGFLK